MGAGGRGRRPRRQPGRKELEGEREAARDRGGQGLDVSTRILWGRYPAEEAGAAAGSVALAQGAPCPVLIVPPKS